MKGLYRCILVLNKAVIVFFYFWLQLDLVVSCTAALLLNVSAKPQGLSSAAGIRAFVATIGKFGLESAPSLTTSYRYRLYLLGISLAIVRVQMLPALSQFTAHESALAHLALKADQSGPDLPVDVLPLDLLHVVHELDESVQVKEPVRHVLRYYLPVEVDENFGVRTHHPLVLIVGEKLSAVDAPADYWGALVLAVRRVDQSLQLLHE